MNSPTTKGRVVCYKYKNHTTAKRKMTRESSLVISSANWREKRNDKQFDLPVLKLFT